MEATTITEQLMEELSGRVLIIKEKLAQYHAAGKKLFATSSFQTQSLPLLHILSELDFTVPIYFIDTGFLFPETYLFKEKLSNQLHLKIVTLQSATSKLRQLDKQQQFLFMTDPDHCCFVNKILPLEPIIQQHDIWINGVRESQSKTREKFHEDMQGKHGILRYHPLLKWTAKEIYYYAKYYGLPEHPLQSKGYASLGCIPCTTTLINASTLSRKGRWAGMRKEECGLHTELMGVENK
ncbi:Phosphoadenosine phosphosulfate reductase [Legionella beliardensis]|uniref:Adenosine 5'-phosphosulfate reductase n=1 Tax=Legionella beliardensis TaxID=91822 RepID=A0A378HYF0_9GAMM|nr:phosphoadenylyl-sulfate reductase [Legionella beliardensis]STX27919.1 Phosphoadenosine phosphosulfate reductase [Legionella beliardensis]